MEKPSQNSIDEQRSATTPTRRTFLAGASYVAMAAATMSGAATGLSSAAPAAKSAGGGNSPSGGPVTKVTANGKIVKLDPKPVSTPMFTSTLVQLGPEEVLSEPPRPDDIRPMVSLASVEPGMKYAPHLHDGRSLLVHLPGLKFTPGNRYPEPVSIRFDGAAPTREFNKGGTAGPEGGREYVMYPYGYAVIPMFKDRSDPLVVSTYNALPDKGAAWRSQPMPPAWREPPSQTHNPLDRAKQARKADGFTAYLCQIGSKAWSTEYDYYDSTPYLALVDFEPNAVMPAALHNGWSGVGVIDGSIEVSGIASTEGAFILFEPLAKQVFRAGPKGSTVMMFFDSGRAAFPVWENPTDAAVIDVNNALRVPS